MAKGMGGMPKDKMKRETGKDMAKVIKGKKTEPDVTPAVKARGGALARKLAGKKL